MKSILNRRVPPRAATLCFGPGRHQPKTTSSAVNSAAFATRPLYKDFYKNPHYKSIASGRNRLTRPAVKAVMAQAGTTWRRVEAKTLFGRSRR